MAHTLEELESLLEGRALVGRVLREEPDADYVITDVSYFRRTRIVTLKLATGDCTFTLKDVEALLDGRKVGGMGKRWNKAYTLLPAEEEPGRQDAAPTGQLAEMEANAQWLQAATEFFAKEPERTYTTAELVSRLGMLRSAVATTREQSKPAKPALPAKWEGRWWDVYLRFFMDGKAMPIAAAEADKAVDIARKHLEGE